MEYYPPIYNQYVDNGFRLLTLLGFSKDQITTCISTLNVLLLEKLYYGII